MLLCRPEAGGVSALHLRPHRPDLGQSKNLTKSTKHKDVSALRRVSVRNRMLGVLMILAEVSCCGVCLSPASTSDAAPLALM